MISVEQIRLLETKVQKAVSMLATLQEENAVLKSRLSKYESRIDELEFMIEEFKEDQTEIEQGIISALNKLDGLESVTRELHPAAPSSEQPASSSTEQPAETEELPPQEIAQSPEESLVVEQEPESTLAVDVGETDTSSEEYQDNDESDEQAEEDPNQLEIF